MKAKLASAAGSDMLSQAQEIGGVKLLATQLEWYPVRICVAVLDQLKNKIGSGVIILGVADEAAGKVSLIAGATEDLTERVKAGELVNHVASQVGGKGGGRADMAQAGGSQPEALAGALSSVPAWLEKHSANHKAGGNYLQPAFC